MWLYGTADGSMFKGLAGTDRIVSQTTGFVLQCFVAVMNVVFAGNTRSRVQALWLLLWFRLASERPCDLIRCLARSDGSCSSG